MHLCQHAQQMGKYTETAVVELSFQIQDENALMNKATAVCAFLDLILRKRGTNQ